METSLFDYDLPAERIAQKPVEKRDASKLLVVNRRRQQIEHRCFRDLPDYLLPTDKIFRNKAKVLPARLFANRPTGGQVECLLLRQAQRKELEVRPVARSSTSEAWWCLLKPGKRLPNGSTFSKDDFFEAEVLEKNRNAEYLISFRLKKHASTREMAQELGKMPLPPYISRRKNDERDSEDRNRYQTVYADSEKQVAAAAPTAGLHFTPELNMVLSKQGISFHDLILHVGMGTFKPLEAETIEEHEIHRETYEIPTATQKALFEAVKQQQRRIAVGTTSVRSIEDFLAKKDQPEDSPFIDEAGLFIFPPYTFKGVDALITNFHLPRSTLLCLVASFLIPGRNDGIHWLKEIYAEAISENYRFLSYGDAMLIV